MEPRIPAEVPDPELGDDPKLIELRPEFADLIRLVLADLVAVGFKPKIHCGYRSAWQQHQKFEKGFSKSKVPGAHNYGYAADIIDRRYGWPQKESAPEFWEAAAEFFMSLRASCDRHAVGNGGWWFGRRHPDGARATAARPTHPSVWNKFGMGWDVAHSFYIDPPASWKHEYLR